MNNSFPKPDCSRKNKGKGPNSGPKHPSHLKGKQIGMYYAKQRRQKWQQQNGCEYNEKYKMTKKHEVITTVTMGTRNERYVEDILQQIKHTKSTSEQSLDDKLEKGKQIPECSNRSKRRPWRLAINLSHLKVNRFLDELYKSELEKKMQDDSYRRLLQFRKQLPSYAAVEDIIDLVETNQVVVITGETGCGKTTQVSQFILDYYITNEEGSTCKIVCTQPRRISAISVAERVAQERAETCGKGSSVGYQIRLESKQPRETGSILYCTTGIMLQWLQSDANLAKISHIILDEIHERTLESDFLLIILKDLLQKRPDLKVILMSATLNAEMFSAYFNNCPMLNIPGFTYPVQKYMLEDVLEVTGYRPESKFSNNKVLKAKWKKYTRKGKEQIKKFEEMQQNRVQFLSTLEGRYSPDTIRALYDYDENTIDLNLIVVLVKYICTMQDEGAILIFLPGWEQISKLHTLLTEEPYFRLNMSHYLIIPLHSLMPTVNQKEVFNQPPLSVRKIILSTNIAETSITIDDVVYVIDTGKMKMNNFDAENNISTLKPEWIAKANCQQRRGRAGRIQPGVCYHLFTSWQERQLEDYLPPEMLRIRLEELCLKIKLLELGDIESFISRAIQQPHIKTLNSSIELLQKLNAFDEHQNLTSLGYHLAKLPLDPHTGKMILFGAMFSCLDPILTIAASLNFKDAFVIPLGKEELVDSKKRELADNTQSDHLMLVQAFSGWETAVGRGNEYQYCTRYFLSASTLRMLNNMKKQFARYLHELHFLHCDYLKHPDFNMNSNNEALIKAIICAGLYPNVSKLKSKKKKENGRPPQPKLFTRENGRVFFHPKCVNYRERIFRSEWLVYYRKIRSSDIFLHDTTIVNPYPLLFFGGTITRGMENEYETITIDNHIVFRCPKKVACLVMDLRSELDQLLYRKISQPSVTNWDQSETEGVLLKAIVDLITQEESNEIRSDMPIDIDSDFD